MTRPAVLGALALLLLGAAAPAAAEPAWWISVGGQAAVETGRLDEVLGTEGSGLLGAGVHLLRLGPLRLGPEVEGSGGRLTADLGVVEDDVTVWRGRFGVRAAWEPAGAGAWLVPYLRGGGLYRFDRGDLVSDEGLGWYVGVSLDVRLGPHWALGPFFIYEAVSLSVRTETVLVGVGLTFAP